MRTLLAFAILAGAADAATFRAGAARVDISPTSFPVRANCMFLERSADRVNDPLFAKAIVLDDGATRVAIVVVDSCMMPRELIDRAKALASQRTKIPSDRMLVSATHTHSAPAAMGCLGSDAQDDYAASLPARIAEAIAAANARLAPAQAGWTSVDDYDHTHTRRWILRPDKMRTDPFGNINVRANMHPGYESPDAIAESGPVDPALSMLSIRSADRRPVAVLANYSQHYFGSALLSADYFGVFSEKLRERIGAGPEFIGILSQGTSGDQMWMDYGKPKSNIALDEYSAQVADRAFAAWKTIRYGDRLPLAMAEATLTLGRRTPDAARLEWARGLFAKTPGGKPRNQQEVYAREAILLAEEPRRELKLQAIRIGELGIAAIPNEVFALTGLKIKARSPLALTFNIELANGAEGYIPPPEQHLLGGYTTWPARTAGLEPQAEPRIVETVLTLLEKVSGRPRRQTRPVPGPANAVAYWGLGDMEIPLARDAAGKHDARFEGPVALYLPGPAGLPSRSVYFAGGRLVTPLDLASLGGRYTIAGWFWPGIENASLFGVALPLAPKRWYRLELRLRGQTATLLRDGTPLDVTPRMPPAGPFTIEGFEGKIAGLAVLR